MIYRRKTYIVEPSFIDEFNQLFNEILLPSQLKYGARLIGRWMIDKDENNTEVFAMWEYDSYEDYERIESQIKSDEEHVMKVRQRFDLIGRERLKQVLKEDIKQEFVKSTVPREKNDIKLIHDLVSLQPEKL